MSLVKMHSRIQSQWIWAATGDCDGQSTQLRFSVQLDCRLDTWQWTNELRCHEELWTNCLYGKLYQVFVTKILSWKICSNKCLFRQSLQNILLTPQVLYVLKGILRLGTWDDWKMREETIRTCFDSWEVNEMFPNYINFNGSWIWL